MDKGNGGGKEYAAFNANALKAMKSMRRQMRFVRNKGTSMVVAGSASAQILNGEVDETKQELEIETSLNEMNESAEEFVTASVPSNSTPIQKPLVIESKQRMSKAQRKQLKKGKTTSDSITNNASNDGKKSKQVDYRDHEHYIDTTKNFNERQSQMEAAMQPSSSTSAKDPKAQALRMEEAMLDIVGDENTDLVMKQRMMRWDKSKRKYIQTTLGQELKGGPGSSKKVRTESGAYIKTDKAKVGELYEKWQKKTQKSIGRNGVFDDDGGDAEDTRGDDQIAKLQQRVAQQNKNMKGAGKDSGLKSAMQIRKERESKQNMKIKNMEKGDRKRYEANKKGVNDAKNSKNGYQGKKGFSGNWGKKKR